MFLEWGGELYNIAVLVSLDVQAEGLSQPEGFRGSSKEPPSHLEKEDIPFLKEQSLHTFVYTNAVPGSCEESVWVIQQCYKNVYRLGQWACSIHL